MIKYHIRTILLYVISNVTLIKYNFNKSFFENKVKC